jgi:dTDP-4-dehydrorhamnose 3,5-epimerase
MHQPHKFRLQTVSDTRGGLVKVLDRAVKAELPHPFSVVEINHVVNHSAGTIRGFHFQHSPFQEAKVLTVLRGSIYDVLCSLHPAEPDAPRYIPFALHARDADALYIPPGYAHGYQTYEDDTVMLYLHNEDYDPMRYARFNPLDPELAVPWPLAVSEISAADRAAPTWRSVYQRFQG